MACLPKQGLDVTGKPLIASGWGTTSFERPTHPKTLQFITLHGISNEECIAEYKTSRNITSDMLCAIGKNHDTSPCYGDSGGSVT